MDYKDINGIGSEIMDAVNDAVNRGDFSGLNDTLRNVTGAAAGTAANAAQSFSERMQEAFGTPGAGSAREGGRTYGHAGRSSVNQTEEYMKRARGASHHTTYSSRISPFLQRKVSKSSGLGSIVGGIVSFVFAGLALLDTFMTGMLGLLMPHSGGFFNAGSIFALVICAGLAILGGILVKKGQERKKLVREYYEYGKIAGTGEYVEIGKLARAMGESRETVLGNLEKMMSEDMLPAAWFDRQKTTLILSEDLYNEYLRLERERAANEAEKAKSRMQEMGAGQDMEAAAAQDRSVSDDLKLTPEDQKLPADARKIVEEGLLYIGRIRRFNTEIEDEEISAQLAHLEITMKRIIDQVRKDPSSASGLRRLMVYYLPTTMKLLEAYGELDRQPVQGENITSTREQIREALGTINEAFENLLDSMFQDMAWDISSDISVMKTMMAQDGLTGNGIRDRGQQAGRAQTAADNQQTVPAGQESSPAGQEYTDGYTEGYTEGYAEGGAAQAAAAPGTAGQEDSEGIKLTFGE